MITEKVQIKKDDIFSKLDHKSLRVDNTNLKYNSQNI